MSNEKVYAIPEAQLLRLLENNKKGLKNSTATYSVNESHLFDLLSGCSKKNKCKSYGMSHCKCYADSLKYDKKELALIAPLDTVA